MYGFDSSFSSSFVSVLECIIQNHFPPFLWSIILLFCWKAKENYSLNTKAVYTISKPPRKLLFDGCDTSLWGSRKTFSAGIQHPTCVLASFLRIISIYWNKREHHTTLQSDFTIQNVSWWWFFSFDTPWRADSLMRNLWKYVKMCDFDEMFPL